MELSEKTVTLRHLRPTEGMYLTQKVLKDGETRFFNGNEIYLAPTQSMDDFEEWTEAEKLEWEEAEKARMEAEIAEHEREMSNN